MDEKTVLLVLAVLVGVCAVALLIQVILWLAIYGVARRLQKSLGGFTPQAAALFEGARAAVAETRERIRGITATGHELVYLTRKQTLRCDVFFHDLKARGRNQLDRAGMVLDDTLTRAFEPAQVIRKGIMQPVRQLQRVFGGVSSAISVIRMARKSWTRAAGRPESTLRRPA